MPRPVYEVSHYINGEFVPGGNRFEIRYPATNEVIGTAPEATQEEVDAAVQAARQAFRSWGQASPSARRKVLKAFAEAIRKHHDELAELETLDVGRTIRDNRAGYIRGLASTIEYFADLAVNVGSEAYPMPSGYLNYVLRSPVGVAGLITPWNVPMMLFTWKLAPALAFGNTVVLKPAELTPLGAWRLAQLAHEAGMPPGVLNVVHGFGPNSAGAYITEHPDVDLISFTGESATGKTIMAAAAKSLKRVSFELGGKGANIVFADADLDRAVKVSLQAAFHNQGQFCVAGSRLLVQRSIYEPFLEKFTAAARELRPGDPMNPETTLGALISAEHLQRVAGYIEAARQSGATIRLGGDRPALPAPFNQGNFLNATIIEGLPSEHRVCQEEIFGPVVAALPFDSEEEAVEIANGVDYGLSAVIQTRDVGRALRVASALNVGNVWVNDFFVRDLRTPFGGMKQSGIGREGGTYSLNFWTEVKTVCVSSK